jgi:ubiquinone/menaquinone biosynthesis C-methylase UbiE
VLNAKPLHYSLHRYYIDEFYLRHVPALPADSRVLDLGGNKVRKRGQFDIEHYDFRVYYTNITTDKCPDVKADAAYLPFMEESFDVVICSELLEHIPDPLVVLQDVYRVLRINGVLMISVPFLSRIHPDPYDYGRYTDHYWQENLASIGFNEIVIEKQGLFWSVLLEMIRSLISQIASEGKLRPKLILRILTKLINLGRKKAISCESKLVYQRHPFYSSFTTGFCIVAHK